MIDKSLDKCRSLSDLDEFLQHVEPKLGRFGGRFFVSKDTNEESSMNAIVYKLQELVNMKQLDKSKLGSCCEKIERLENSIDLSKVGLIVQILTKIRQKVGNFFFSLTHNQFDREQVLLKLGYIKTTDFTAFVDGLEKQNPKVVSAILHELSDKQVVQYVNDFLHSIYRKAKRNDKRIELLLEALQKRFPHVPFDHYFIPKFEGHILCPDGLRIVLDYLKTKGALKQDAHIIVCDSLEDLTEEVRKLDWQKEFRVGFLVRGRNKERPTELHIIPGYIEHKPGMSVELLVTDTAGKAESIYGGVKTTYTNMFVKYFQMGLPQEAQLKVYANGFLRQYNWTACPIFSVRDLVQIFRNPQLMQQVKDRYNTSAEQIVFMDALPLVLMKPHHGLTVLDKIADTKAGREEPVGYNKQKEPESLYDNLLKHKFEIFTGENRKLINNYTNEREVKYLGVILSKILLNE